MIRQELCVPTCVPNPFSAIENMVARRVQWIGGMFVFEGSHLGSRRRQADQVKVHTANERSRRGFWRWVHSGFTKFSEDKVIEGQAWPSAVAHHWNRWIYNRLKSPMFPLFTLSLAKR